MFNKALKWLRAGIRKKKFKERLIHRIESRRRYALPKYDQFDGYKYNRKLRLYRYVEYDKYTGKKTREFLIPSIRLESMWGSLHYEYNKYGKRQI